MGLLIGVRGTMGLLKCPYCSRRFESVRASRSHVQTIHLDEGEGHRSDGVAVDAE